LLHCSRGPLLAHRFLRCGAQKSVAIGGQRTPRRAECQSQEPAQRLPDTTFTSWRGERMNRSTKDGRVGRGSLSRPRRAPPLSRGSDHSRPAARASHPWAEARSSWHILDGPTRATVHGRGSGSRHHHDVAPNQASREQRLLRASNLRSPVNGTAIFGGGVRGCHDHNFLNGVVARADPQRRTARTRNRVGRTCNVEVE
jgi:hypothetical protein